MQQKLALNGKLLLPTLSKRESLGNRVHPTKSRQNLTILSSLWGAAGENEAIFCTALFLLDQCT
ncbi:hypothetical protein [Acidovorax sp. A1169]|uniref:hypothetical protein n=1 Tax=Acidovorax sp. A1169 TaxID=3059524 RepID=UPI002737C853|nr:hypothetical protein [Acidovorax sp. A1169]MDP4075694.1 hypothetical protein [Acidovorax sp. A1169]